MASDVGNLVAELPQRQDINGASPESESVGKVSQLLLWNGEAFAQMAERCVDVGIFRPSSRVENDSSTTSQHRHDHDELKQHPSISMQ